VAHEVLQQPEVVTLVTEGVTRAMAQHVGPHPSETGALAGSADQVVDRLPLMGWPRSETNSQGRLSSRVARYRLIARSSSPSMASRCRASVGKEFSDPPV
jgi:hypothetical protein